MQTMLEHGISLIKTSRWPPNSPDLNPLDYFFWNEVETILTKRKYSNRAQLVQQIKKAVSEISLGKIRYSKVSLLVYEKLRWHTAIEY